MGTGAAPGLASNTVALRPETARGADETPHALLDRAVTLHRAGRVEKALVLYRRLLALTPDDPELLNFLGVALLQSGELDGALGHLREAARLDPHNPAIRTNLGNGLRSANDLDGAAAEYRRAVALAPNDTGALRNLAKVLASLGALEEAEGLLRAAIAQRPDLAEAYRQLAEIRPDAILPTDIERMERSLGSEQISSGDAIQYCFALGRALEARGSHDLAFRNFQRGNALKRGSQGYAIGADEAWATRIAEIFDRRFLARHAGAGDPSDMPIFVVGMPRSGSTLVEQILASHPAVHGSGELALLSEIVPGLAKVSPDGSLFPDSVADTRPETWAELGSDYVAGLRALAPASARVTDKMPSNLFCIGLIHLILPNARIVHCRRDPRDTCVACYTTLFSSGQLFAYDLSELGRYHVLCDRLMAHWRSVMPGKIHDVSYEALVSDADGETRKLLGFLGLPFEESCLRFHDSKRPVQTASAPQVRRPIYRTAVGRWRRYAGHLGPLLDMLQTGGAGSPLTRPS